LTALGVFDDRSWLPLHLVQFPCAVFVKVELILAGILGQDQFQPTARINLNEATGHRESEYMPAGCMILADEMQVITRHIDSLDERGQPVTDKCPCNLEETEQHALPVTRKQLRLTVKPAEIVTLKLQLSPC
jgi:hypothetical protein